MRYRHKPVVIDDTRGCNEVCDWVIKTIKNIPTADVQEVRHGRWIVKDITPYCSVCHRPSEYECDGSHSKPLFCPNCGTKMDKE